MKMNLVLLTICSTLILFAEKSNAFDLRVAGAFQSTSGTISSNTAVTMAAGSAQSTYGGGLLADFDFGKMFVFETGGLYIQRKVEAKATLGANSATIDQTLTDIQIPVLVFVKLGNVVRLGAGAAYNLAVGNISTDQTDPSGSFGGTFTGKSQTYAQLNDASSDWAGVAAVDFHFPVGKKADLFVRGSYELGLTNLDTSGTQPTKINLIQGLAGVMFSL